MGTSHCLRHPDDSCRMELAPQTTAPLISDPADLTRHWNDTANRKTAHSGCQYWPRVLESSRAPNSVMLMPPSARIVPAIVPLPPPVMTYDPLKSPPFDGD